MEHKLIQGGEQYLPFARSRIKAMRATGAKYASQRFSMGDAEVNVQIVGDHDYIRLSGGVYNILSGVVKAGTVIAGSPDVLRSFKPTEQCWEFPLKKREGTSTAAFHDEPILAINAHANIGVSGSQYTNLCSSMYSGLMAKAVQVILGIGKQKPTDDGVQVKYDYRWARCHGITIAADGKAWLIEISQAEGVLAMRLPLIKGTAGLVGSKQKVLSETVKLFKGIPSGATFPTGALLTEAITAGTVLRLKTAAEMNTVFSKNAFSATLGWSFNDTGSEAHNTCYATVSGVQTSYHYRIDISLEEVKSATLTEVSNGPLYGASTFKFHNAISNTYSLMPFTAWPGGHPNGTYLAPIFVCHINGVLEIVRHCGLKRTSSTLVSVNAGAMPLENGDGTGALDPLNGFGPYTFQWRQVDNLPSTATCLQSDRYPETVYPSSFSREEQNSLSNYASHVQGGITYLFPFFVRTLVSSTVRAPVGAMLSGARDGYAFRASSTLKTVRVQSKYLTLSLFSFPFTNVPAGVQFVTVSPGYEGRAQASFAPPSGISFPGSGSQVITPGPWVDVFDIITRDHSVITQTINYESLAAAQTADGLWTGSGGVVNARYSTFGSTPHILYSQNVVGSNSTIFLGSMFSGETNPSTTKYSFVGYI
jgi:hypothetical protein